MDCSLGPFQVHKVTQVAFFAAWQSSCHYSNKKFSPYSLLLVLLQSNTTHLSNIFGIRFRVLQNSFTSSSLMPSRHDMTTKLSFRSARHKLLVPCLFHGTQHFVHLAVQGQRNTLAMGLIQTKEHFLKKKRNKRHFSNILKFILKIFEMT